MHSYIQIHHFEPVTAYQPIEKLYPFIEKTMKEQRAVRRLGTEGAEHLRENLIRCLEVYYRLVGIDEKVIEGRGSVMPDGILPRYTESLIRYFQDLDHAIPANEEIATLRYSGVDTIKIRYKYTDSVIKKLIKLGLRDPSVLEEPLKIFLNGGALHDLIGILFVCSYPYEKEWVARTLYHFFEYDHRTDDHLLYGFYTVKKKSGYRALHCDHTLFNPRFDANIAQREECHTFNDDTLFACYDPADAPADILGKFKNCFNIEIQLHTTFENLWASMEHTSSYNIQAKGAGRSSKITVQWKLLSDAMQNLEEQFERLQVETEQARFEVLHHSGYVPVQDLLEMIGSDTYPVYNTSRKKVQELENLLTSREISRQDYVQQLQQEVEYLDNFSQQQNDPTVRTIFDIHATFIYYGLANQNKYFNDYDIRQFAQKSLERYSVISRFLSTHDQVYLGNVLNIVAIFRYLYLGHKYGMGLINPPKEIYLDDDTPIAGYGEILSFFKTGIDLLNELGDSSLEMLARDGAATLKIINHYDILAREWELFNAEDDSERCETIAGAIALFRKKYITALLLDKFNSLLESNEIKNIGFVVKFYSTLVWHGLLRPMHALKQIIKYSAYDTIKASDLFYYELSAYRFQLIKRCETVDDCNGEPGKSASDTARLRHLRDYHRKNMIQLLFRIKKKESNYKFQKARLYFEQLTQTPFKLDHFSDTVQKGEER